jgi:hypothetical protein
MVAMLVLMIGGEIIAGFGMDAIEASRGLNGYRAKKA